jgi:transmembrane sensor
LDELIFRESKGQLTEEEERQIAAWRAASPENEARYQLVAGMLRSYAQLERESRVTEPPPIAEIIRPRRRFRVLPGRDVRPSRRRRRLLQAGGVAAAAIVFLSLHLTGLWPSGDVEFGTEDFFTGKAERAVIELRDGTVVRLGPESRLTLLASREQREVTLSGRAFFAVAKQSGKRFTIHTAAGALTVLGTRFDVEARERDLRLIVVEGRVAVASPEGRSEIAAGEMSRVLDGKRLPTVSVPDAAQFVEWVGNFLAFQSTPLSEVALEIERKYGMPVEIADSVLAKRTITAWFSDRPLTDVLRVVCLAAAAHCTVADGVIRIDGA